MFLVSARNFEYDNLYVHYIVDLPKGWYNASGKRMEGITPICKSREIDDASFFKLWPLSE